MANSLLKTVTIDGVSIDALTVGKYLELGANNTAVFGLTPVEKTKTVTLANNASTNYEMFTAPETGFYIIWYTADFPANTSGARFSTLYNIDGSTGYNIMQRTGASPSGTTVHSGAGIVFFPAGRKVGIRLFQNSGTNFTNNVKLQVLAQYIPRER